MTLKTTLRRPRILHTAILTVLCGATLLATRSASAQVGPPIGLPPIRSSAYTAPVPVLTLFPAVPADAYSTPRMTPCEVGPPIGLPPIRPSAYTAPVLTLFPAVPADAWLFTPLGFAWWGASWDQALWGSSR